MSTRKKTTTTKTKRRGNKTIKITQIIEEEVAGSGSTTGSVAQAVAASVGSQSQKPRQKNHITIVLDDSISMDSCFGEALNQVRNTIAKVQKEAADKDQDATITIYVFSSTVRCLMYRVPAAEVKLPKNLRASGGSTALIDGVCTSIDRQFEEKDVDDPNTSFLFITVTDGEENDSRYYSKYTMADKFKATQERGNFTHAFIVPNEHGRRYLTGLGVPKDNITIWEATAESAKVVFKETNDSLGLYFESRTKGMRSTTKFYATADASKLTKAEIMAKLTDVQNNFRRYEVPKEMPANEFFDKVLKTAWVSGSLYYQLSKKEKKVHAQKDVLIMKRGEKSVWAGDAARELVGLPAKGKDAEVDIGNLGDYEVYVKSTSYNRALVRGTHVLVDVAKLTSGVGDPETWDRAAAQAAADAKKNKATTI